MKKLYYFSRSKLQFIEIKNFTVKLAAFAGLSFVVLGIIIFGISSLVGSSGNYQSLKNENEQLRSKLHNTMSLYSKLEKELDSLVKSNNDLRIAANLPALSEDERKVGVGGGYYDNNIDFLKDGSDIDISQALSYIDDVSRRINFEKDQYLKIEKKLKDNEKLALAIPAIVPSPGTLAEHGFGMRLHPILHVKRMHEGIDIITDVGTKVCAAGTGVVDFVGYRGGFGLAVEIDHGFGYRTIYAHLSSASVKVNQKVSRGDLIAKTGNTGLSSGPHLHYEVLHNGEKKDPREFFFEDMGFFEIKNNKYSSIKK